jgi:hypothetical protein
MKKVIGNLNNLINNYTGTITFILYNKYDTPILNNGIEQITNIEVIINEDGTFETTLLSKEEDKSDGSYYIIKLNTSPEKLLPLKIYTHRITENTNIFQSLIKTEILASFFHRESRDNSIIFNSKAIETIDKFLEKDEQFLNLNENKLIDLYCKYADGEIQSEVLEKLDIELGRIGE